MEDTPTMIFPVRTFLKGISKRFHQRLHDLEHCYGPANYHSPRNYHPTVNADSPLIVMDVPFTNDAQTVAHLMAIRRGLDRHRRVVVLSGSVFFFRLIRWLAPFTRTVDLLPQPQFTAAKFARLVRSTGFEVTREEPLQFLPFGHGLIDRLLCGIPGLRRFAVCRLTFLRPYHPTAALKRDTCVIIPLRNEAGNVPGLFADLDRLKDIADEVIFVEGNSTDDTWPNLQAACAAYRGPARLQLLKQPGRGKKDAVRFALSKVTSDLIVVYDADRTVSAEDLLRFHATYHQGKGDFINGSRLTRPMEKGAMQPLNIVGNHFFANLLAFALDLPLTDSLCGTKLFPRVQYERMRRWTDRYPDFDPFGDFELLFPAAALGLGATEVEVSYLARRYGTTNIQRFRDGWRLLKMSLFGIYRIRMGAVPKIPTAQQNASHHSAAA